VTSVIFEALREEEALLRRRLGVIEQALALIVPAYTSPEPPPVDVPRAAAVSVKRPSRATRRRRVARDEVRDYVVAYGPVPRGQIVAGLGGHPKTMDNKLRSLLASGEIEADGPSGARLYRGPQPKAQPPAGGPGRKAGPASSVPERGVYPVYDAIRDLGGATTQQLVAATGLPATIVVEQGRRLRQLDLVRFAGQGADRLWVTTDGAPGRDAL
jgi:hypothetical protein